MNKLYDTLIKIKNQPGLYLGKPSIKRLSIFLNGFTFSCYLYQGDKNDCEILNGFQSYIEKKYLIDQKTTNDWATIIQFFCIDEEHAFKQFFVDFEEFLLSKHNI